MSTSHSNSELRPTCKMTPEQLLGLQSRAKTATLSPEISIIDPDAAPNVIVAAGTQESIPIIIDFDSEIDAVIEELTAEPTPEPRGQFPDKTSPRPVGCGGRIRVVCSGYGG